MTEPNILNISIDDDFIKESIEMYSIDFKKIENNLKKDGLDEVMISHLMNEY